MGLFDRKETFRSDYKENFVFTEEEKDNRVFLTKRSFVLFDVPRLINIINECYANERCGIGDYYKLEETNVRKITRFLLNTFFDDPVRYENVCSSCICNKHRYTVPAKNNAGFLSNEYDRFLKFIDNRGYYDKNLILNEQNKKSIEVVLFQILMRGWKLDLIAVRSDYRIAMGQHRFMALRIAQLPIQFIIDDTIKGDDLRHLNASYSGYGVQDVISRGVNIGDRSLTIWHELFEKYNKYGINMGVLGIIFFGREVNTKNIEKPNYRLTDDMVTEKKPFFDYLYEIYEILEEKHKILVAQGEIRNSVKLVGGKTDAFYEAIILALGYVDTMDIEELKELIKNAIDMYIMLPAYRARYSNVYSATATLDGMVKMYWKENNYNRRKDKDGKKLKAPNILSKYNDIYGSK